MKKLHSISTDDMNRCFVTGIEASEDNRNGIEIHHIFIGRFYDDRCNEKTFLNGEFEWRL